MSNQKNFQISNTHQLRSVQRFCGSLIDIINVVRDKYDIPEVLSLASDKTIGGIICLEPILDDMVFLYNKAEERFAAEFFPECSEYNPDIEYVRRKFISFDDLVKTSIEKMDNKTGKIPVLEMAVLLREKVLDLGKLWNKLYIDMASTKSDLEPTRKQVLAAKYGIQWIPESFVDKDPGGR